MNITSRKYRLIDRILGIACLGFVVVFGITSFVVSKIEYDQYVKDYENNLNEIFLKTPKAPESVAIDNDFVIYDENGYSIKESKSEYKNIFTCMASEAYFYSSVNGGNHAKVEVSSTKNSYGTNVSTLGPAGGGGVEFTFDVEYGCYADIDIVLASAFYSPSASGNIATEGLTKWIKMTIDNLNIDADDVVLPVNNAGDWHNYQHVILKNVHLKTGENVLKLETKISHPDHAGEFVFPNLSRIHVFAGEKFVGPKLSVSAESAYISKENGAYYFNLSGNAIGYTKEQIMMDLCLANETFSRIDKESFIYDVVDNRYIMKVKLDDMAKGVYYPHLYVDGDLYQTGQKEGRILVQNMDYMYTNKTVDIQVVDSYKVQFVNKQLVLIID